MNDAPSGIGESSRRLSLVFGGAPKELHGTEFRFPAELGIAGTLPNFASGCAAWAAWAWRAQAWRTVDNALRRTFIVHLHQFWDPATGRA